MLWYLWIAAGIIFMIIEIITPGFIFFSIGTGAIITGIFSRIIDNVPLQFVIFAVSTLISFLLMKKFAGFILKTDNTQSNVNALIGKTGTVTKMILPGKRGYVKVDGEEWSAIAQDSKLNIKEGSSVKVLKSEGNKLIIIPNTEEV